MSIVRDDQIGSLNFSTPKVILVTVTPSPTARAASTNVVGIVGQFNRGTVGSVLTVGSMNEVGRKLGFYSSEEGLDGYYFMQNFFDANGSLAKVVRVASTGTVAATGTVFDDAGTTPLGTFTADSVGTWGKYLKVDIADNTISGYSNITVRNTKTNEVRQYIKTTTDSTDDRYIKTLVDEDPSKFFTYTSLVTDGTVFGEGTTSFSGGSNGTDTGDDLSDTAYVGTESGGIRTGIQAFKSQQYGEDVSIVVSARNTDTINTGLITHVNDITLSPRRTIIAFAQGTSVDSALTKMATLDDDKVKVSFPYVKVRNLFTNQDETFSPIAFDAANDSLLSYHLSASQTAYPATVKDLELDLSGSDIDSLTKARINPIVLRIGRGYLRASDYTTSSNPALAQNVVRKAKDYFARTFYSLLQFYISKPITPALWQEIKSGLETFLGIEAAAGRIGKTDGSKPYAVKVDSENNPTEIVQLNKIIILVQIALLAPADIIQVFLDASQDKTIVA